MTVIYSGDLWQLFTTLPTKRKVALHGLTAVAADARLQACFSRCFEILHDAFCTCLVFIVANPNGHQSVHGDFARGPAQVTAVYFRVDIVSTQFITQQLRIDNILGVVNFQHV